MSLSNSSILSPKQREFILNSTAKINIAHGAVRSGKTHASLIRFAELVLTCPDNKIIMIGNSFGSIVENAVKPLAEDLFRGYCTWQRGNQTLIIGDKSIRVIGAHDESAVRAIQGNTHSLAYGDEITTIPAGFVDMLTTRLSHPWSKLVATCNPNSPVHPIKTQFIDCQDPYYAYSLHFEIDDNPGLDERTKSDLKTKYSGLFYQRYIKGLWVMAEGAIFADFGRDSHVIPRAPGFAEKYYVGIDYGAQNPFSAVMIGYRSKHSPRFWVEKEFYWNPAKTFRQKTNSEYADDIERFIEGYNIAGLYLDPSAESFQVELRRRKIRVIEAVNDVFPGITFVANLISNHQLKIVNCCPNLIGEMEMYVWDAKKALRGIEEPVKQNDHCCDAMRYALYSAFGQKMRMDIPTGEEVERKQLESLSQHGFYGMQQQRRWD
jgi:PBSX family phage terminase large subunit